MEILHYYKNQLINLNSQNRSLRIGKLAKIRSFDLQQMELYENTSVAQVMRQILTTTKEELEIEVIPNANQASDLLEQVIAKRVNMWSEKQASPIVEAEKVARTNQERESITKKAKEIENSLLKLSKNINDQIKETGIDNLYLGYLFICGKLNDGTRVTAPLLLFPAELKKGQGKAWKLKVGTTPKINKVLLLALQTLEKVRIDLNEFEQNFAWDEWKNQPLSAYANFFAKYNFSLKVVGDNVTAFKERNVIDFDRAFADKQTLELHHYVVLGDFPVANAIYENYEAMIEENLTTKEMETLLTPTAQLANLDKLKLEKINEGDQFFISPLDASQEQAIAAIKQHDNIVVYGPPGTGKSQMITNLIADMLAHNKRVLMVSQKKVAVDVIASRLGKIGSNYVTVTNTAKDKKVVYEKLAKLLQSNIHASVSQTQVRRNNLAKTLQQYSQKIEQSIEILEEINTFLHSERTFGKTLQEMYQGISSEKTTKVFRAEFEALSQTYQTLFRSYATLEQYLEQLMNEQYLTDMYTLRELESNEFVEPIVTQKEMSKVYELEDAIRDLKAALLEPATVSVEVADELPEDRESIQWQLEHFISFMKQTKNRNLTAQIAALNQNKQDLQQFITELEWICTPARFNRFDQALHENNYAELVAILTDMQDALDHHQTVQNLRAKMETLNELEYNLLSEQVAKQNEERARQFFLSFIELSFMKKTMNIEQKHRHVLNYMSRFKTIQETIFQQLENKAELSTEYIQLQQQEKLIQLLDTAYGPEIKREVTKKRMQPTLRQLLSKYQTQLFDIMPCWLMTPETVADILPLTAYLFDIVIFDEASQILVETAIPTIYRGKKIVIVGDDKQLPPSDLFLKHGEVDGDEVLIEDAIFEEKSLLDIAKVKYPDARLNYHYRARYSELIQFSNAAYYNGNLEVSPNVEYSTKRKVIQRFKVENARFEAGVNEVEAQKIAQLIVNIFKKRTQNESVGIIVFNARQKECVEEQLELCMQKDQVFRSLYEQDERSSNGEDRSLFIKNIENVQGDERDIIVLGTTYAPNENGTVSTRFGSLTNEGGENRLNVAISRAKQKVFVVTSIEPEQLRVETSKNLGPKLFRKYLEYARAVDRVDPAGSKAILDTLIEGSQSGPRLYEQYLNSDNVNRLIQQLRAAGYVIHEKVGTSKYGFDFAVYDEASQRYVLGVELDETPYKVFSQTRERDIFNHRFLQAKGWNVTRIWSKDLADDLPKVMDELVKLIEEA